MTDKIAVFIADDHPVVRQGLSAFLALQSDIELVGEASDGREAVDKVLDLVPDVVLMDLAMPVLDGIEAIRLIRTNSPSTKVIALTSFNDEGRLVAAVRAGAAGYLLKDTEPSEIVRGIRMVSNGEALISPSAAAKLMQELAHDRSDQAADSLTERELEVLRLIAQGLSNKQIATHLVLSEKTVKTHVSNILAKLHLADRTQAALYAVKKRLVDIDYER